METRNEEEECTKARCSSGERESRFSRCSRRVMRFCCCQVQSFQRELEMSAQQVGRVEAFMKVTRGGQGELL